MTKRRLLLNLLGLTALLLVIWYGGTSKSKIANKSYRNTVDKNGIFVRAIVTGKKYLKGRYVVFEYNYNGRQFTNKEQNREYYKTLIIGETIEIKIDTINPKNAYIFATGIK